MDNNYNYGYTTPTASNSTLAIVSLVSGILGWSLVPFLGAIVAVITGHMAKKEIRESGSRLTGDGLATAGLVLGYANIAISICAICGFIAYFLLIAGILSTSTEYNSLIRLVI